MTSDQISHYDPDQQQYVPQYEPAPETPVRMLPPSPRGPRGYVNMVDMAQLGAEAGSRGVTSAEVTALLQDLQTIGIKASVEMFPKVMEKMHSVHVARIGEIIQRVQRLYKVQIPVLVPAPGFQGTMGRQQLQAPAPDSPQYVQLDQVLGLLMEAQVDPGR